MIISRSMTRVHVVFDGINGAGKSTYRTTFENTQKEKIKSLLKDGENSLFLGECVASDEQRQKWYGNLGKGPTDIDYEKLHRDMRLKRHTDTISKINGFVSEERHPLAWSYFCPTLLELGKITKTEYHSFMSETLPLMSNVQLPDIWVFVNTFAGIARQRIIQDNSRPNAEREFNTQQYLEILEKNLRQFMMNDVYDWHERLGKPKPHVIIANSSIPLNEVPKLAHRVSEEVFEAVQYQFKLKRGEEDG